MATMRTGAGPEPALPPGHLRPGRRRHGPLRTQDSSGFFEPPGLLPGRAAFLFLLRQVGGRSAIKVPSPPCPCSLSAGREPAIPTRDPGCGLSPRPACGRGPHQARPAPRKAQPRGPADSRREHVVCRGPRQTDGPRPGPLATGPGGHGDRSSRSGRTLPARPRLPRCPLGWGCGDTYLTGLLWQLARYHEGRPVSSALRLQGPGWGGTRGAGAAHGAPGLFL